MDQGSQRQMGRGGVSPSDVLLFLGYGCFWSAFCCGPLSSAFVAGLVGDWTSVLAVQIACLIGTAAGCAALRFVAKHAKISPYSMRGTVSCTTVAVGILVASLLAARFAPGPVAVSLLFFMLGVALAQPLMFWCRRLLEVCRTQGTGSCVALLATAQLVPIIASLLISAAQTPIPFVGAVAMPLGLAASCLCQVLTARSESPEQAAVASTSRNDQAYCLTPYTVALLLCLGFVWGVGSGTAMYAGQSGEQYVSIWALPIILLLSAGIVLAMVYCLNQRGMRFGGLVRVLVAVVGAILAFLPVLHGSDAVVYQALCEVVFIFVEIAVLFFSVEVCFERGLDLHDAMAPNYALFVGGAAVGSACCALLITFVGGQTAWELVGAFSTVAVVALVPFLPSRSSDAVTFTYDNLPENEGTQERTVRQRDLLVSRFGLNERETAVLDLLIQGMTRQQIADELHLSSWTIKDRTASIYEKTGTHSYKELMKLLSGD